MRNSNVVELKPRNEVSASASKARLPAPLAKLRVRFGAHLKKLMERLFERIDDTFFDLADQAVSNSEQAVYFDAMREIRIKKSLIANDFLAAYQQDFQFAPETLQDKKMFEFDTKNLAVVQNDELEEQVAIDNIISRIKSEVGQDLDHLTQRLGYLLPTVDIRDDTNPVGGYRLANNFAKACQPLELDIRSKLVLYKIFEKQVLSQVKSMLAAANNYLIEQGVLPDLSLVRRSSDARPPNRQPPSDDKPQAHLIDAKTEVVSDAQDSYNAVQQQATLQADPFAMIAQLQQHMPAFNPGKASMSLPVLRHPSLMSALTVAQNALIQDMAVTNKQKTVPVNEAGLINFVKLMQRMMKGQDGNPRARIGQSDQDAINLVTMLFDFILEDRQLQAPVKAILGRLQIPLVKVALVDKTFFRKGGHIARRFLNELAMASVGWTEKGSAGRDPFLEKLEAVVCRINNEFIDDVSIFQDVLDDFQLFQEAEKKRRVRVEQRTRDCEEGRAKTEAAKRYVQNKLNRFLDGSDTTDPVLSLLREGWSNYLVLLNLKHGSAHPSVLEAEQSAALLIAATSHKDKSAALTADGIETLLLTIKKGLLHAAYLPHALDKHMHELKACLLAKAEKDSMKANSAEELAGSESAKAEPVPDVTLIQPEPVSETLNSPLDNNQHSQLDRLVLQENAAVKARQVDEAESFKDKSFFAGSLNEKTDLPGSHAAADRAALAFAANPKIVLLKDEPEIREEDLDQRSLALVGKLAIGSWVEIRETEGKFYRCKLAAIIYSTDRYIFVNRMGVKVAEKSKATLVQQVFDGTVQLLDDGLLFDRALESVISSLRK